MEDVIKKLYKVYENKSEASNFQARTASSKLCFGFTFVSLSYSTPNPHPSFLPFQAKHWVCQMLVNN